MNVYLLMKHPPYPYNRGLHIKAAEVVGVYSDRTEPDRIASEKNARKSMYLWCVVRKAVKAAGAGPAIVAKESKG